MDKLQPLIAPTRNLLNKFDTNLSEFCRENKALRKSIVYGITAFILFIYIAGIPAVLYPTCLHFEKSIFLIKVFYVFPIHFIIATVLLCCILRSYYLCVTTPNTYTQYPKGSEPHHLYCMTCRQSKPLRVHHCQVCNRCQLRMDHHCVFMNNCIGYHNFRFFILFLLWASLGACYVGFITATRFTELVFNWKRIQKETGATPVWDLMLSVLLFSLMLPILGLLLMMALRQLFAINYNLTEVERAKLNKWRKEEIRKGNQPKNVGSPFDRGFLLNLLQFFGPVDPGALLMIAPTPLSDRRGIEYQIKNVPELSDTSYREIWGIPSTYISENSYRSPNFSSRSSVRKRNDAEQLPEYFV